MTLRQKYHKNRKVTIYEIVCLTSSQRYIGSTINYYKRKGQHKSNRNDCESKNIIKNNNYKFNILEEFYCNYELSKLLKEQYYLDNLENINLQKALTLTKKKKSERRKDYRKKNDINIKLKYKQKYECICGANVVINGKQRHFRSKKHLDYLRKNTI